MDGITLAAVRCELQAHYAGAKIEKIYQSEKDELMLHLRGGEKLLLSASASNGRVQLTRASRKNPPEPPMFCMLLRKHIGNGRLIAFEQPGFDRILRISIAAENELGEPCVFYLIAEIMGKHSNLILTKEDGTIVDAVRHVTPAISSVRCIMPGLKYENPPSQQKLDPREVAKEHIRALLDAPGRLDKAVMGAYSGICPAFAREIALRSAGEESPLCENLTPGQKDFAARQISAFFRMLREGDFAPTLVLNSYQEAVAVYPFDPRSYEEAYKRPYERIGEALDEYYALRDAGERVRQKGASLHKILSNNIERCQKKLAIQRDIIAQSSRLEEYRLYGELLTANVYRIERGVLSARVENYYDENMAPIDIPLDPALSPSENAARYFKKYTKTKAAYAMADEQIQKIQEELDYLEGTLDSLEKCTEENELREIREELTREGYIRPDKNARRSPKGPQSKPLHFLSSDGLDLYVGKNNVQNDNLTLRFASGEDIWLHTKNIPGSHVILKADKGISDTALLEAAHLAAYYSKARGGAQVAVDYTPRKYVKKPSGARPGFVIYSTNRTLYVTPQESVVKSLRQV
jgi:predicted ribosome quality control (RQC) complex YloA/Tae2 family protein